MVKITYVRRNCVRTETNNGAIPAQAQKESVSLKRKLDCFSPPSRLSTSSEEAEKKAEEKEEEKEESGSTISLDENEEEGAKEVDQNASVGNAERLVVQVTEHDESEDSLFSSDDSKDKADCPAVSKQAESDSLFSSDEDEKGAKVTKQKVVVNRVERPLLVHENDESDSLFSSDGEDDQRMVHNRENPGEAQERDESDSLFSSDGENDEGAIQQNEAVEEDARDVTFPAPFVRKKKLKQGVNRSSQAPLIVLGESSDEFFFRDKWGEKLIMKSIKLPSKEPLKKVIEFAGIKYSIVATKHEKAEKMKKRQWSNSNHGPKGCVKAYYVALSHGHLQNQLNRLGHFAALEPCKAASRLELMVSPASKDNGSPRIWLLLPSEFDVIDDNYHLGCGFIPVKKLEDLIGTPGISAIQVRIYSAAIGHFKGMLMAKNRISKIQLPKSMLKVPPSLQKTNSIEMDEVFLLCKLVFPSSANQMLNRHINPHLVSPPRSASAILKRISMPIKTIMVHAGVPRDVVQAFDHDAAYGWDRKHWAHCVGVADPTCCLPEGSIFVTGLGIGKSNAKVFITRSPCTDVYDAKLLPIISKKPNRMKSEDWKHLCSIHFGLVVFATPKSGRARPLPEIIADGDLDGDLYFICWDPEVLSYMVPETFVDNESHDTVVQSSPPRQNDVDLIGQEMSVKIGGKEMKGIIVRKAVEGGDNFICDFGGIHGQKTLSEAEILANRDFPLEILGHRGSGIGTEVQVKWHIRGTLSWQKLRVLRKGADELCAAYAIQEGLLETLGWEWAKEYDRGANVERIIGHRGHEKSLEVHVLWDQGETDWISAEELSKDDIEANRDMLAKYGHANDLIKSEAWNWATKHFEKRSLTWFDAVQDVLIDTERLVEHSRLYEILYRAWSLSVNNIDEDKADARALGRAYKQSLDIAKHGGMVDIPFHLRKHVNEKRLYKYLRFP